MIDLCKYSFEIRALNLETLDLHKYNHRSPWIKREPYPGLMGYLSTSVTKTASDVLHKNLPSLINRFKLGETFNLNEQFLLDQPLLKSLKNDFQLKSCFFTEKFYFRTGIEHLKGDEHKVSLSVKLSKLKKELKLKGPVLNAMKVISGSKYNKLTGKIVFQSEQFPFIEQNKVSAMESLKKLIDLAKEHSQKIGKASLIRPKKVKPRGYKIPEWMNTVSTTEEQQQQQLESVVNKA